MQKLTYIEDSYDSVISQDEIQNIKNLLSQINQLMLKIINLESDNYSLIVNSKQKLGEEIKKKI